MRHISRSRIIGAILLVVAIVVTVGVSVAIRSAPGRGGDARAADGAARSRAQSVTGYLGGEKASLFDDPDFRKLLSEHGFDVDYRKAGSLEMASADKKGIDYAFPSSQIALDWWKASNDGKAGVASDAIFTSPIVIYTYRDVAEALAKQGMASSRDGVWSLDLAKAWHALTTDATWADLGLPNLYGQFRIDSSDPTKSNSGNLWAALLATVANGGQTPTRESVARDLPAIRAAFAKAGYLASSSEDTLESFLAQGEGSKPMTVGYESQTLDYARTEPDRFAQIKDDLVVMYPTPTVWSTHEFIALDSRAKGLMDVLKTAQVQRYAWTHHGFRGRDGKAGDPRSFGVSGVTASVPSVAPLPPFDAMKALIDGLADS